MVGDNFETGLASRHWRVCVEDTLQICWYGVKSFADILGNDDSYTFAWLRLGADPSDQQIDDTLQEIRSRTRGLYRRDAML